MIYKDTVYCTWLQMCAVGEWIQQRLPSTTTIYCFHKCYGIANCMAITTMQGNCIQTYTHVSTHAHTHIHTYNHTQPHTHTHVHAAPSLTKLLHKLLVLVQLLQVVHSHAGDAPCLGLITVLSITQQTYLHVRPGNVPQSARGVGDEGSALRWYKHTYSIPSAYSMAVSAEVSLGYL